MQKNLFGEGEIQVLSIVEAAKIASVSTATIRNWLKTGYLFQPRKGCVSKDSLDAFMAEVAGKEKLNARANKQLKDDHDHTEVSDNVTHLINTFKGEEIGTQYENSLSNSYRNKEGIYYTPSALVDDMFKGIPITPELTFIDPCCGSGNFLVEAIRKGVAPENVFGFDLDANAVLIAKQRIKDEFGYDTVNVKVGNFLEEAQALRQTHQRFDLIFTNPPWGKKMDKSIKEKYSTLFGCGNSLDTTSLFFGASLSLLTPSGYLGFLIQEAFFNISTFEDIRKKVLAKRILRFVDYDRAFKGLMTKAQAIIIENKPSDTQDMIDCETKTTHFQRTLESFVQNPKHIFNFWTNETEARIINHLYSIKHITLKGKAHWALGIVTGNNERYCSSEPKAGYVPIYKGSDITKAGLKEPSNYILNDFSKFQQVAPLEMYQAKEKLMYKFISSDLCFYCDTKQRYVLNSANLLIPDNVGVTGEELTALLNSKIMNWLFKKLFSTHKVLRGDLEYLPIHVDYFVDYHTFSETDYLNYLNLKILENGTYGIER
jgi:site-specific DNA-methyltransferase (adenine-specific)